MKEDVVGKRLIKIPLGSAIDPSTVKDIETLKNDLDAMGVSLAVSGSLLGGTLVFEYDSEAHKRNAGRKKKAIPENSTIAGMTPEQLDEWLLNASISEIQEALDVGRATAYRRVSEARSRVEYAVVSLESANDVIEGEESSIN